MRINLHCPFAEKEEAKSLGAKWDQSLKVWYLWNVEDLTPFMRWIKPERARAQSDVTLTQYLAIAYNGRKSLGAKAAKAFGVPYNPLKPGWVQRYADSTISAEKAGELIGQIKGKPQATDRPNRAEKPKAGKSFLTIGKQYVEDLVDYGCPPWEAADSYAEIRSLRLVN